MKPKFSYSSAKWSIGLTAFIAAGSSHVVCAAPQTISAKRYDKSFVDTEILDSEDLYDEQDWQEFLMESETMNSSATALLAAPEVFKARVVSDEIAPFVFHNDENACEVDDVRLQLPVEEEIVTARVVSSEVAPFKWVEDEPDLEDEILRFETPRVKRRARVVSSKVAPFKWVSNDE